MESNNNFKSILHQRINKLKENELFDSAVSHLLIFVGANFAGNSFTSNNLIEDFEPIDSLRDISFNELSFGLNKPFSGSRLIEHLWAAKEAFSCLPFSSSDSSFIHLFWKYRFLNIWFNILNDKQIELIKQINELSIILFNYCSSINQNLHIEFLLERAISLLNFFEFNSAKKCLEEAIKIAGFKQLQLSGALGKRTQFQVKSVPQLFVEFELTPNSSQKIIEEPIEIVKNTKNEDDTLLEKIIFDEQQIKNERINSHQTACILINALLERNENKFEKELGDEKIMAFLDEVIEQRPCWSIQMRALIERSKLEAKNSRKIERACSQMEILAKILNESVNNNKLIQTERFNLIFTSSPLPFWKVDKLHAEILLSLGCFSNAIQIFEKLNYWEEVVKCYLNSGQTEKAEFLIKKLLKEKEDPLYYCLLGNITNKEFYYLKAIELSNDENSLARTSLGNLFLRKKNFSEAIKHFERSLAIQPLQIGVYFNYGYSAMKIKDFQTSVKAFHRCVSIEPEHFEAWNNLGASYIQLNQKFRAHKILQEALKLSWENTFLWTNFLLICVDIGDFKNAISSFEKLMDLDKNFKLDEYPLEIILIEILNNFKEEERENILELKKLILKVLARASSRQSLSGKVQRLYALLKKPENEEDITQYSNFVYLLEKSFKKEFDKITLEKLNKNYKDLLNQLLELINEFKILWRIQKLQEEQINFQLKLRINPIIKYFEKEFDENCEKIEDEEFKQLFKEIKNFI